MLIFIGTLWAESTFVEVLTESQKFTVVVDDVLGEGQGIDPQPLYPQDQVNCLIWLQWVLARFYSTTEDEFLNRLNSIRYHHSTVDYGHRKHFVDRWTTLEPGPLKSSALCETDSARKVSLNLEGFAARNGYEGQFYEPNQRFFLLSFSSKKAFVSCLSGLPEGYYVLFPIATEEYLARWDSPSPMLQVHAMVLEHQNGTKRLWHASIDKKGVVFEDPVQFSERMGTMIQGFKLYELAEDWP